MRQNNDGTPYTQPLTSRGHTEPVRTSVKKSHYALVKSPLPTATLMH
ncbi:hypothetical protein LCGC14_2074180 [marine sediment metagenome]|uniref:Uncharacterized protein n=1 Tax=marine sediment metagenome TaxID=412755 RepID=A0A0F9F4U2_9ZZZZ